MDWIVKYRQFRRHGCLKIDLGFGQCCAGGRCHLSWVPWRNVGTKQITWNFLSFRQGTSIVAWWSSSSSSTFKLHQSQNALSGCRTLKSKGCNWYNVRTISSYADALTYSYHLLPSLTISYHLLPYLTCNHDFYWFLSISHVSLRAMPSFQELFPWASRSSPGSRTSSWCCVRPSYLLHCVPSVRCWAKTSATVSDPEFP